MDKIEPIKPIPSEINVRPESRNSLLFNEFAKKLQEAIEDRKKRLKEARKKK